MKPRLYILISAAGMALLCGGLWLTTIIIRHARVPEQPKPVREVLHVEVIGAVVHPGEYDLDPDSRVLHALAAAGGYAPGADTNINLAAHVYDGQRLKIPFLHQAEAPILPSSTPPVLKEAGIPTGEAGGETTVVATAVSIPVPEDCSNPVVGNGVFVWPTEAHFISGNDFSFEHPGIDIAAGLGSPVYAADSGMVRSIGSDTSGYGNMLEIDHGNGYSTFYAHLTTFEVGMCQNVTASQRIGTAGDTGNADGVHLHFAVIQNGVYIDPWSVLPAP